MGLFELITKRIKTLNMSFFFSKKNNPTKINKETNDFEGKREIDFIENKNNIIKIFEINEVPEENIYLQLLSFENIYFLKNKPIKKIKIGDKIVYFSSFPLKVDYKNFYNWIEVTEDSLYFGQDMALELLKFLKINISNEVGNSKKLRWDIIDGNFYTNFGVILGNPIDQEKVLKKISCLRYIQDVKSLDYGRFEIEFKKQINILKYQKMEVDFNDYSYYYSKERDEYLRIKINKNVEFGREI